MAFSMPKSRLNRRDDRVEVCVPKPIMFANRWIRIWITWGVSNLDQTVYDKNSTNSMVCQMPEQKREYENEYTNTSKLQRTVVHSTESTSHYI